mmetsp:Transcript_5604/g.12599  ORF Transcript_5604/g.12599 Transcript_5604/m.12599 type:complete len:203 (-) Transcript_5604:267-875(-)
MPEADAVGAPGIVPRPMRPQSCDTCEKRGGAELPPTLKGVSPRTPVSSISNTTSLLFGSTAHFCSTMSHRAPILPKPSAGFVMDTLRTPPTFIVGIAPLPMMPSSKPGHDSPDPSPKMKFLALSATSSLLLASKFTLTMSPSSSPTTFGPSPCLMSQYASPDTPFTGCGTHAGSTTSSASAGAAVASTPAAMDATIARFISP